MTIQVALPDGTPVQIPLSAGLEPNQSLVVPVKVPKKMPTVSILYLMWIKRMKYYKTITTNHYYGRGQNKCCKK